MWCERRIAGLDDDVRPGAPRSIDDERVASLIKPTLHTKPADGSTHWSVRGVAAETGISKSSVHRCFRLVGGSRGAPRDSSCPTILSSSPAQRHGWRALHLIPTLSSWLNQVERIFALITDKAIRSRFNGPPLSTRSLRDCIDVSHVSAGQDTGLGCLESNPPRGSAVAKPRSRWRLVAGCWSQPARSGRGARNTARCCNNRKL